MSDEAFFKELKGDFISEGLFLLDNYEEHILGLESEDNRAEHLTQIFRVAHSIKGGASAVGFADLAHFAHNAEDLLAILRVTPALTNRHIISLFLQVGDEFKKRLEELKNESPVEWNHTELLNKVIAMKTQLEDPAGINFLVEKTPEEQFPMDGLSPNIQPTVAIEPKEEELKIQPQPTKQSNPTAMTAIKVDLKKIDSVLDAVGEIVVLKNQLVHSDAVRGGLNPRLAEIVDAVDKSVRELYEKTLGIRMTPLKSLFLKIQRIVRDVSISVNKSVDLTLTGEETEVERTVFEMLGDPLVHLVRNAIDHGVESTSLRVEKNKSATAKITVSAKQAGGKVVIEIRDDGGGIDRQRVLKKAIEKNLIPGGLDPNTMTDNQVYQLLFAPGFSTAETVSDLSGRGVGLDVVKSNLEKINGKIEIESQLGKGSCFRLLIPLTTAITDGVVVEMKNHHYIIPTYSITEIVQISKSEFTVLPDSSRMVRIRDSLLSVIDVGNLFELGSAKSPEKPMGRYNEDRQMLVIVETGHQNVALPVDEVLGQTQAVVKPFQTGQDVPEISGAAVLGDGRTVLIIDTAALMAGKKWEVA